MALIRLSDADKGRDNNLNLIRFILASSVILSHCYVLLSQFEHEPMHELLHFGDLGGTAVYSFFFISGFLISKSAATTRSVTNFLLARCLRIFPALITAVLLCLFVVGPVFSTLPLSEYLADPLFLNFPLQMLLHPNENRLPGLFVGTSAQQSVNGPVWTLATEWLMYIVTLFVFFGARLIQKSVNITRFEWVLIFITTIFTLQMLPLPWKHAAHWILFFLLGSACYCIRHRIRLSLIISIIFLLASLFALRFFPLFGKLTFPFALPYAILTIAYHPKVYFCAFHHIGDYSYGLYILGWPIQQIFAQLAHGSPVQLFALSYPCALLAAIISWHFVEKPSLAYKR